MIEFKKLALAFPDQKIFEDFPATIKKGEFIGIFGPNGAGKSTLLRAILGLIKPISGNILVNGKSIPRGSSTIGYMPQLMHNLYDSNLSARSYIQAVVDGFRFGLPFINKPQHENVARVINLVGAVSYIDRPLAELSGGERRRVMLAEALLNSPKILLLDEPLSGLDPAQQGKMVDLIKSLQKQLKITVLFTAHDLNPLLHVLDRIIYLAGGKASIGKINDVVTSKKLSELYDSPIKVVNANGHIFVVHEQYKSNFHDTSHLYE